MAKTVRPKLTKQDLKDAIFVPNKAKAGKPTTDDGVVIYTLQGKGDISTDDGYDILVDRMRKNNSDQTVKDIAEHRHTAYAKTITINGKTRCFVKIGRSGKFIDPLAAIPSDNALYVRTHGKDEWTFREVNSKVFNYYLNYLKTKNNAWLITAEREHV